MRANVKRTALRAAFRHARRRREVWRKREVRFEHALRRSPIVLFQQDHELRYVWIFNTFAGIPREDILGRTDFDLFPGTEADRLTALKRVALEAGKQDRATVDLTHRGQVVSYDLTVKPWRASGARIAGVYGAGVDVSEHRRAEGAWPRQLQQEASAVPSAHLAALRDRLAEIEVEYAQLAELASWLLLEYHRLHRVIHSRRGRGRFVRPRGGKIIPFRWRDRPGDTP